MALVLAGCKPTKPFSYVEISGEIILDTKEQKLVFAEPFAPIKQSNDVCFQYSDTAQIEHIDKAPILSDGKPLIIDAKLTDTSGKYVELNRIVRNKAGYLCLSPNDYNWWLSIYKTDVRFNALSVKTNRQIVISKIEWESHNAWDLK